MELDCLSLYGVRSFKPTLTGDTVEFGQVIQFDTPISILYGDNGSGKSAILETLQYAITGREPLGTQQGRTFWFDPKLEGVDETFGQISLTLRKPPLYSDTKSLIWKFKSTLKPNDDLPSCTLRSAYIETSTERTNNLKENEMCAKIRQIFPVNKDILHYVHFCTHLESDWGYREPTKFKEILDKLFEFNINAKYLKELIKKEKSLMTELRKFEATLQSLQDFYEKYKMKTQDFEDREEEKSHLHLELEDLEEQLQIHKERLRKLKDVSASIVEINQLQSQIKILQPRVSQILALDINDLKSRLTTLEAESENQGARRQELEDRIKALDDSLSEFVKESGKFELENDHYQENVGECLQLLSEICDSLDLANLPDSSHISSVNTIIENVSTQVQALNTEAETELSNINQLIKLKEQELNSARALKARTEKEMEMHKNEHEMKSQSFQNIFTQSPIQEFSDMQECSQINLQEFLTIKKEQVNKIDSQIKALRTKLGWLEKESDRLKRKSILENSLRELRKSQESLQRKVDECQRSMSKSLEQVNQFVDDKIYGGSRDWSKFEDDLLSLEPRLLKKQQLYKTKLLDVQKREIEFNQMTTQIQDVMKDSVKAFGEPFQPDALDKELDRVKNCLEQTIKEESMLDTKIQYLQYLIDQLSEDFKKCPTCFRPFDKSNEIEQVEMIKKMHDAEIKRLQEVRASGCLLDKIKAITHQKDTLHNIKLRWSQCDNVSTRNEKEAFLEQRKAKLSEFETEISRMESGKSESSNKLQIIRSTCGELDTLSTKISNAEANVAEIDRERDVSQSKDLNLTTDSAPDVQSKILDVKRDLDQLQNQKQEIDASREEMLSRLQEVSEQMTLQQNALQDKSRCEELAKLLNEMKPQAEDCEEKILSLENELLVLRAQFKNVETRYTKDITEWETKKSKLLAHISVEIQIKNKRTQFDNLHIKNVADKAELHKLKEALINLKDQQAIVQNLRDNLALKSLQEKLNKLHSKCQTQLQELQLHVNVCDTNSISQELRSSEVTIEDLGERWSKATGILGQVQEEILRIQEELKHDFYVKAAKYPEEMKKLKKMKIEHIRTKTEREAKDQEILDKHSMKITAINNELAQYWPQIYGGTDIETIQIKIDYNTAALRLDQVSLTSETGTGGNLQARFRKAYNSRVIMRVNSKEVNMRDRSSAGQKVLACLCIRIVLAELLGHPSFKVLAIDDPTSGLDDMNRNLVVNSIVRLAIENKYQIIVSSQDTIFVRSLLTAGNVPHFWHVEKERKYSTINKKGAAWLLLQRLADENDANGSTSSNGQQSQNDGPPPSKRRH